MNHAITGYKRGSGFDDCRLEYDPRQLALVESCRLNLKRRVTLARDAFGRSGTTKS
jgi:hypothetical protein